MSKLGQIIKHRREELGLSQDELSKKINIGQSSLQKIETGYTKATPKIVALAMALDLSPIYLETLDEKYATLGAMDIPKGDYIVDKKEDDIYLPLSNVTASMGRGAVPPNFDQVVETLKVTKKWVSMELPNISNLNNLALLTAVGDSMEPTFKSGDILIIDQGVVTLQSNSSIYAFEFNDNFFVKRLHINPVTNVIHVKSDNQFGDNWEITQTHFNELRILGRVIYAWSSKRL